MKIIALPDLHEAVSHIEAVGNELFHADLVLLVGDLTNAGKAEDAIRVLDAVGKFNTNILAVPGNWDTAQVDEILTLRGINLHRRHLTLDDVTFIGVGGSLPLNNTPKEIPEVKFEEYLNEAIEGAPNQGTKILVCHQPPFNTYKLNDRPWIAIEVGSKTVRTFIEQHQPGICFTGHVHEAQGVTVIGQTRVVNPGPLWQGKYAYAEITPSTLNIEIRSLP